MPAKFYNQMSPNGQEIFVHGSFSTSFVPNPTKSNQKQDVVKIWHKTLAH